MFRLLPCFSLLISLQSLVCAQELVISPVGDFADLAKARDEARRIKAKTMVLKSGTYFLSKTLVLEAADSGLSFIAEPGAAPLVAGVVEVGGWKPFQGAILKTTAPKGVTPKQLLYKGERQILARYPNFDPKDPLYGGWAFVEDFPASGAPQGHDWNRELYVKAKDLRKWAHPEDVQIDIFAQYGWWNFLEPVLSLDSSSRKLTLAKACGYDLHPHNRFHFQNALEELDSPGEWFWDKRTGELYFWPPKKDKAPKVWLPVVQSIIQIKGASDVKIVGIDFTGCEGTAITMENASNCLIERCRLDQCGGFHGAGVSINGGAACRVTRCEISRTGSSGVGLTGGDRKKLTGPKHIVDNCHIHDVGFFNKNGPGVSLYGVELIAEHNHIHHCPRMAVQMSGNFCKVEWNHIHHVVLETQDGGAIYTGGRDWISSRGTSWSYNLIHDVVGCGQEKEGLKHPWFTFGLYPDDNSGGIDIIGNIVYRCATSCIHLHNSRDCRVENNIFSGAGKYAFDLHGWREDMSFFKNHLKTMIEGYDSVKDEPAWKGMRGMEINPRHPFRDDGTMMSGNVVSRNIVLCEEGSLYGDIRHCTPKWNTIDQNLAWAAGMPVRTNVSRVGNDVGPDLLAGAGSLDGQVAGSTPKGWGWNHRPGKVELRMTEDGALTADSAVSDDPKNPHSTFHGPNVGLKPGGAYRIRARIKSSAPGMRVELALAAYEPGKGYWQAKGAGFAASPEWQAVEVTARVPRQGASDFKDWIKTGWLRIDSHSPSGTVSIDDVVITEAEPLDEWNAWQAEGWDQNSLVADPQFINPDQDDFRLQPTSPAFRLGFKKIPFELMGIQPEG
ncbi:MAG: right-handed parallel beta-helix repeat-containing protein [Verrucomicrobiaceae bacterium]|nr:right-handed parallel beta-helix repeat-containing protein [Verrucomicrobiaceae bacterium]